VHYFRCKELRAPQSRDGFAGSGCRTRAPDAAVAAAPVGTQVKVEADVIAEYVERLLTTK
jgi:hypothetical protein